jgi:hypothetical protein
VAARPGPRWHPKDRAFYRRLRESLADCARAEFELSARQGDGATLRTHLQRVAKNTKEVDPLLTMEWPKEGRPLWDAFCKMGRPAGVSGPGELTSQEILAYQQLWGVQFNRWELEVIHMFDGIAMEAQSRASQKT